MNKPEKKSNLYFKDPRMEMTVVGRFFVRIVSYVTLFSLIVTAFAFLISSVRQPDLRFAGLLIVLFLIDYGLHFKEPRKQITYRVFAKIKKGDSINIAHFVAPRLFRTLMAAIDASRLTKKNLHLHIIDRLLELKEIKNGLMRMDVDVDEFEKKVEEFIKKGEDIAPRFKFQSLAILEGLMRIAFLTAARNQDAFLQPYDVFSALFHVEDEEVKKLFSLFELEKRDMENALIFAKYKKDSSAFNSLLPRPLTAGRKKSNVKVMNRAWTARPTPTLDQFSTDLTALARVKKIGFLIGHKIELDRLTDVLSRPMKGSALLVGSPGSGRHALVEHLALMIVEDHVPKPLFDKRVVELSIGNVVAGAEQSVLQDRVKTIADEIITAGNIILSIPDLHNILRTSGGKQLSAGDVLLPHITKGDFQTVGATDPRSYKRYIEQVPDFKDAFETIQMKEITEENAIRLMVLESILLEKRYKIIISYKAVKRAVQLAKRYITDKLLPSSAQDLLKEVFAWAKESGKKGIKEDDVVDIVERKVEVPIHTATAKEAEKLLSLEQEIHKNFIDQEEAVKVVSQALREYRSGLARQGGPIATFLFVGPTGVGKTELSKNLARIQFGSEKSMLRFDMSEFQEKETISRFLGSSDGELSGQLTEAVRLKPHSLVLLDEFEKAHPDILNIFLQVFDDGRLSDGLGNVVDFTNTIIIATSNAHSEYIQQQVQQGRAVDDVADDLKRKLTAFFRPELLNRFSDIVIFKTLAIEHIEQIARLNISKLADILDETHGIALVADDNAIRAIAEQGYEPEFGARPLRKVVSERLKSKLANAILQGEVGRGDIVHLTFTDGDFVFSRHVEEQ